MGGLIFHGLVSLTAAAHAFVWPGLTALTLVLLIAAWAIVTGVVEIVTAIELRKLITGEWRLILAGLLSVVFGVAIVAFPAAGALAVVWWIGAVAIVLGALLIALAFWLRRLELGSAGRAA